MAAAMNSSKKQRKSCLGMVKMEAFDDSHFMHQAVRVGHTDHIGSIVSLMACIFDLKKKFLCNWTPFHKIQDFVDPLPSSLTFFLSVITSCSHVRIKCFGGVLDARKVTAQSKGGKE